MLNADDILYFTGMVDGVSELSCTFSFTFSLVFPLAADSSLTLHLQNVVSVYNKWVLDGKPIDSKNNGLKLSKDDAKAIVILPSGKMKDYNGMAVCVKWLGGIAGGTTWNRKIEHCKLSVEGNNN